MKIWKNRLMFFQAISFGVKEDIKVYAANYYKANIDKGNFTI